jgi:nucleoside-diphosphate-sugar epimerase
MRVLVTGNEGYLGSVLTRSLSASGHDVVGIDSGLFHDCLTGDLPAIETLRRDIRDVEPDDFRDVDAVVHLAGLSNDPLGNLDAGVTMAINHEAAVRVAECAKAAGAQRFVFASSCSVYGQAGDELLKEGSPLAPQTPYAMSKLRAEQDLARLAADGFSLVLLRFATIYGASPCLRFDLVINNLTAWAVSTGRVHLKSDGMAWRPVFHVRDAANVIGEGLTSPQFGRGVHIFNVGRTEENYRVRQLAALVEAEIEGARISYSETADSDRRNYRVDCDRLRIALPDLRPNWTVRGGIAEVRDQIERLAVSTDSFEGPRLRRSDHLIALQQEGRLNQAFRWTQPVATHSPGWKAYP